MNVQNPSITILIHAVVGAFMMGTVPDFERAGLPISLRLMRINTYLYLAMAPKAAPTEVVMKGMGLLNRTAPGVFKLMMGKMVSLSQKKQRLSSIPSSNIFKSYWLDEILPEVKQHLAYFESSDLRGMSLDQLRAHLAETLKRVERIGGLHRVIIPSAFALDQFEALYCELLEGASTLDALLNSRKALTTRYW